MMALLASRGKPPPAGCPRAPFVDALLKLITEISSVFASGEGGFAW